MKPCTIITVTLDRDFREALLLFQHPDRVALAPTVWCDRFSLRQVSQKRGKYDGAERIRLLFRRRPKAWTYLPCASLRKRDLENAVALSLVGVDDAVLWAAEFRADWSVADKPHVARNTVFGHAIRHFPREIAEDGEIIREATEEVQAALDAGGHYMPDARKLADIALARMAHDYGWRKCPARVQRRKGCSLWVKEDG